MSAVDELIAHHCPDGVEFLPIGSFAKCQSGATPDTQNADFWISGSVPWLSSGEVNKGTIYSTEKYITPSGFESCSTKMIPSGSVVMALAGQGKTRGTVGRTRIELCTNQSLCAIVPDDVDVVDSDFLYYFLSTQYQNLRQLSSGDGARGGLNLQMIREFKVPVPPLHVQQEVVRVLDAFTQLEAELEAELEARRKQYEFYRDQLLTFPGEGGGTVASDG